MSLSDIMSGAGLAGYAEVGLVLFLLSFLAIAIWLFAKRNDADWEAMRHLPLLEDGTRVSPASTGSVSSHAPRSDAPGVKS
jgi:cbb3-type cytochrome oxidase subunit 3